MHGNETVIRTLYSNFACGNHHGMADCYHPDATFEDAVFGLLNQHDLIAMWHMLCEKSTDLELVLDNVIVNNTTGTARWIADYTFSGTGRHVHNIINATFEFRDGKIVKHIDQFSLWRWSRMALGTTGLLMGWTPQVKNKIRKMAKSNLIRFKKQKNDLN